MIMPITPIIVREEPGPPREKFGPYGDSILHGHGAAVRALATWYALSGDEPLLEMSDSFPPAELAACGVAQRALDLRAGE